MYRRILTVLFLLCTLAPFSFANSDPVQKSYKIPYFETRPIIRALEKYKKIQKNGGWEKIGYVKMDFSNKDLIIHLKISTST